MDKAQESCLSNDVSSSSTAALDEIKEEKYRKITFRTLKKGREVDGREYLYLEEENHY